jgi:hypothetical protein
MSKTTEVKDKEDYLERRKVKRERRKRRAKRKRRNATGNMMTT